MSEFVFVILHYMTIDDTEICIRSIKEKVKGKNFDIVVVDNNSPNGTGKIMKKKYKKDRKIHIILNKENLGFAKGNNIGFKYAKEKLNANFIILCNNDTYLLQDDFVNLVEDEYKNSEFAVLGPQILLPNNKINPVIKQLPTLKELKKASLRNKIRVYNEYYVYK